MQFDPPLQPARLVRRYKRFLADVVLADGTQITVHCPNTGAMLGCQDAGALVWLSRSNNPKRKYAHTWELVETEPEVLVGINTGKTNALVREAIEAGTIDIFTGFKSIDPEVRVGTGASRIDFRLNYDNDRECYLEVKNVTAAVQDDVALFPDAVSSRATRHLEELVSLKKAGHRSVLCFCVQRSDVSIVRPADEIDPVYGRALRSAADHGVEIVAYGASVRPELVKIERRLSVNLA